MVKDHKELVRVCGELNLNTLKDKIEVEYQKYLSGLQKIKNDALQWAKEIQEQHEKMLTDKKTGPLPPRTPTLKRPQRKRKIPDKLADDDGKENTIAVSRKARAASQAATSKFYGQLHVPVKLRRPSDESKKQQPPEKKRVRIASSTMDSDDDDAASVATSIVSEKAKPAKTTAPARKLRSKRHAPIAESSDEEPEEVEPVIKTRSKKVAEVSLAANKKTGKKQPKKRKLAKKPDSDSEDTPPPPETTAEHIPSDIATTEAELSQEDTAAKTPEKQPIKKNPNLILSRIVAIKMEKLSETFITNQINAAEEEEKEEESLELQTDAEVSPENEREAESANEKEVQQNIPEKRRSSRNKPVAALKLPGKTPELQALTPHITGKVKERVKAVEQSLQKGYPRVQMGQIEAAATTSRMSPVKESRLLKYPQDNNPETSPDPFADESDAECHNTSPSNLKRKSLTAKKPISASMTNLTMTGTLQKMTVLKDHVSPPKKLFEPSSPMKRRRSKSWGASMKKHSHHSHCCSSQSRPLQGTGTLGRSRVLAGKTFITQAMKDQAQQLVQEAERKKEEERQLREEKLKEAAKKKEELLKSRAEEKKKANEEKRNKVKLLQEQRQKELEAQQRKQEEATRLEKEREEQKKVKDVKDKDEKALKLLEMRAKRLERKKMEDAKKAKEDEAKRAKEEEAKKAKDEEAKKAKEEEEELKKLQTKKIEASKQKILLLAKTIKPINDLAKPTPLAQIMNSTFTKPNEDECKTPKAANPAVSRLAQNNSYVVTPTKDELPPPKPKTDNDYGIDEVTEGDSSDDDEKPKKKVPSWAAKLRGNPQLDCADYIRPAVRNNLFGTRVFKPTITDLFGANARQMTRRSSAVWNTPPNLHHMTLNASMLVD